jgi:hypothetical protein
MPIDINLLRTDKGILNNNDISVLIIIIIGGDPEKVKQSVKSRFKDEKIVDDVLDLDNQWRKRKFCKK